MRQGEIDSVKMMDERKWGHSGWVIAMLKNTSQTKTSSQFSQTFHIIINVLVCVCVCVEFIKFVEARASITNNIMKKKKEMRGLSGPLYLCVDCYVVGSPLRKRHFHRAFALNSTLGRHHTIPVEIFPLFFCEVGSSNYTQRRHNSLLSICDLIVMEYTAQQGISRGKCPFNSVSPQ